MFASHNHAGVSDLIEITYAAEDGYELVPNSIIVNGIPIDGLNFAMLAEDVLISAEFREIEETEIIEHDISFDDIANGSFEISHENAAPVEIIELLVYPNDGYELVPGSITVNGEAIEGLSFEMPDEDVIISAEFRKIEEKIEEPKEEPKVELKEEPKEEKPAQVLDATKEVEELVKTGIESNLGISSLLIVLGLFILRKQYKNTN